MLCNEDPALASSLAMQNIAYRSKKSNSIVMVIPLIALVP